VYFYLVIVAAVVAVWFARELSLSASVPFCLIAFFAIGWAQYSIGNGMHEAVHHNLRNKDGDFWAAMFTAYPIGLTMRYRETHLKHHWHVGTDKDPEFDLYNAFPSSRLAMLGRFIWFFSGIPAGLQFLQQQMQTPPANSGARISEAVTFVGVQLAIMALFYVVFGNVLYYFAFWALPIAMVGKLLSTTRLLCEHGSPDHQWVVRSIDGSRWQTWMMGAFDFNYHAEHHLFPSAILPRVSGIRPRKTPSARRMVDSRNWSRRLSDSACEAAQGSRRARELPWLASRPAPVAG
jgi:fatty acid desaturase